MKKWQPINFKGDWNSDPRGELKRRIEHARLANDAYVAIPVELATALSELRECDATTILSGDEDGPMDPIVVRCKHPKDHQHSHSNGYVSWSD